MLRTLGQEGYARSVCASRGEPPPGPPRFVTEGALIDVSHDRRPPSAADPARHPLATAGLYRVRTSQYSTGRARTARIPLFKAKHAVAIISLTC